MATRMAHFGLCVLLEFYIQLKTTLAPGFSLETRTLSTPHPHLHSQFIQMVGDGASEKNLPRNH